MEPLFLLTPPRLSRNAGTLCHQKIAITPDFVVEQQSSSDSLALANLLQGKMEEYIENGVRLGLLIDRKNYRVYIYRPDAIPDILERPEVVDCEPKLPGFALVIAKIW